MILVRQLSLHGTGIGLISETTINAEIKSGETIRVMPEFKLPTIPVNLIFPHKKMPKRGALFAPEIIAKSSRTSEKIACILDELD